MISLLIETSTERGIVALFSDEKLLHLVELPVGYQNSAHLLPTIQEAFEKVQVKPTDLKLIAVGIGPGSYTGIRVGAITAKTLAYALQIPVVGICSLDGFIPEMECKFAAVIDAKIGGVYVQLDHSIPAVHPLEQAVDLLKNVDVLVTPYAQHLKQKMSGPWRWIERYPDPLHLIRLAYSKYHTGDYSNEGHLDLLYLRKTQAEIEKDLKDNI